MENSERNVGSRKQPVNESVSVPAPWELEPTPVATRSADDMQSRRNNQLHGTYGNAEVPPINRNQNPDRK